MRRVLIVEDEALIALDLEHRLRRLGFEVVGVADHREEALALFAETKPDFVLMDIFLRGSADGIDTAQAIGESSDVPVIFLTAFADDATIDRASEVSPYGYVIKPIDERALVATINVALARHRADRRAHLVRSAVEASPLGVAIVDARGPDRPVVFANHAITAMSAVEAGAPLEPVPCLRTAAPAQESVARLREALARRTHADGLVAGDGADGHPAWVSVSVSPLADSDGNVTHLLVSQQDVSLVTGPGSALAAARRLEVAGRLAAGLAGDFDRTLSEVIAGAETLRLDAEDPWARADLDEILQSAQHAMLLARRLGAMASQRGEVAAPSADLAWVIAETLTAIERVGGPTMQVGLELDPEPMQVAMDPTAIQEVLLRLVGSARAAMPQGGCLTIHTSSVTEHPADRDPWKCARVEVTDTGVGFDPADAAPGTDFAATAMIVDYYGGALRVESRYGVGTRFVLDLPLSDDALGTSPGGALPPEFGRAQGECCLVAVGRPALRRACARALTQAGFSVVEVSRGDAAVRELDARGAAVRLVVADLALPVLDGAALALHAQSRSPGVATLVTTGHLDRGHDHVGPGVAVLWKPFSMVTLARRALELLRASDAPGTAGLPAARAPRYP